MAINVDIKKNGTENTASVLRRFSRRFQSSGIQRHVRDNRYHDRELSSYARRKKKLRKLARADEFESLIKQGKLSESIRGRRTKWRA